jgi:hypothetical protein
MNTDLHQNKQSRSSYFSDRDPFGEHMRRQRPEVFVWQVGKILCGSGVSAIRSAA